MKVFFDGGCHPNPGPMEAAVVIRGKAHVRLGLGTGDNNQAEWLALLLGLELATAAGLQDVTFVGDSTVVVEQAWGRWRCTSPQLEEYLAAFRAGAAAIPRLRLRQVQRAKNLAGIVLARRRDPAARQAAIVTDAGQ
jgi:ribonuclease HI